MKKNKKKTKKKKNKKKTFINNINAVYINMYIQHTDGKARRTVYAAARVYSNIITTRDKPHNGLNNL